MEAILRGLGAGALSNLLGHEGVSIVAAIFLSALVFAVITREIGRFTSANRNQGDGEMILRGSFVLVVYGGAALVFMAAVAWAWRSLFD